MKINSSSNAYRNTCLHNVIKIPLQRHIINSAKVVSISVG